MGIQAENPYVDKHIGQREKERERGYRIPIVQTDICKREVAVGLNKRRAPITC